MKKTIREFEDLIAWQKARALTKEIYRITSKGKFRVDNGLRNQIQRACVSIMSNIAEGFERNRPAEFHQYLSVAKSSCAEVRSQLYIAYDALYLGGPEFERLMEQAKEVGRILGGLRKAVAIRKLDEK